jgi:5'-3' exonuclease
LNGRTLAYEAICLIPFVDESKFLKKEDDLIKSKAITFDSFDEKRNTIYFTYYSYVFNDKLKST